MTPQQMENRIVKYLEGLKADAAESMKAFNFTSMGRAVFESQVLVLHQAIDGIIRGKHLPTKKGKG